ncbi:MAG: phosphatase PAP2 family protein [Spirosomataceae bacterium]
MRFLVVFFSFFLLALYSEAQFPFERRGIERLHETKRVELDPFFQLTTDITYPIAFATPLSLVSVGILRKKPKLTRKGLVSAVGLLGAASVSYIGKESIQRDRPFIQQPNLVPYRLESGYSMPSGTTTAAFAWAAGVSTAFPKWYIAVPAFAVASTIGYSRVHLAAHYPSDVLIGALVGTGSVYITDFLQRKLLKK